MCVFWYTLSAQEGDTLDAWHRSGRLTTPMVRAAREKVRAEGGSVTIPLWGERIV